MAIQNNSFITHSLLLLTFRYQSPVVPLETVIGDYFDHMQIEEARRKANKQQLPFPVFRSEKDNKKSKWMVNISDLALYLDKESKIAKEDHLAMNG